MKKICFRVIGIICIIFVCFIVVHNSMHASHCVIKEEVQSYMNLYGYAECYLTKFEKLSRLKNKKINLEVSENEITGYIESILSENYYKEKIITRNVVELDDLAVSDYKVMDGERELSSVKDAPIRVGTGYYDLFLEQQIIGIEIGREYVIAWNVPEDYENSEWAAKQVNIHIIVKELYKVIIPTIEEYALKNGFATVEEYRTSIKNMLLEEKRESLLNQSVEAIVDELIENSRFEIDEEIIVDNAVEYYNNYKNMADVCNTTVEEYMANSVRKYDNIYEVCYNDSLREITRYLIIGRYAEEKGIVVLEDDIEKFCKENNINNKKEFTENDLISVKYHIIEEKVLRHIAQEYVTIEL